MMVAQFINAKGEMVRVFATDEAFKFRVEKDGADWGFDGMKQMLKEKQKCVSLN